MPNLPLCHWSSQLFDLHAPSSTDVPVLIGSLSNDDDGRVNVAKKLNLRPFKLYRLYLDLLNLSNVRHCSWSRTLYPGSKRERTFRCPMFTSPTKRRIWRFHVVFVRCTLRNSLNALTKLLSAQTLLQPIIIVVIIMMNLYVIDI